MTRASELRTSVGRITLALHGIGACAWLWLMPGGFPLTHPRFLLNRVLPGALLVAVCGAAFDPIRRSTVLIGLAACWASASIAARASFPISASRLWIAGLGLAIVMMWTGRRPRIERSSRPTRDSWVAITIGATIGAAALLCERPPPPSTHPMSSTGSTPREPATPHSASSALAVPCGPLVVHVDPSLSFDGVSVDGAWPWLAPARATRNSPHPDVAIVHGEPLRMTRITATTDVPRPVYAHLSSFTRVWITGHRSLAARFSPAPDVSIEIVPSDYPAGRPARAAYLDASGVLRVVEASSGEKGPFHVLASGPLDRASPLSLTLFDAELPVCRVTLHDWAAQASTELSPTGGWGFPQNAIELERVGDAANAPVVITFALASTSMGRGWDVVGHAAGVYRNRIAFESLAASP